MSIYLIRTGLIFLVLFFLSSCAERSCWQKQTLGNKCSLSYTPNQSFNSVGLQFLQGDYGTIGYVNVFNGDVAPHAFKPEESLLAYTIEGKTTVIKVRRLQGEQKLLLPHESMESVLRALSQDETVTIALQGFQSEIPPHPLCKKLIKSK